MTASTVLPLSSKGSNKPTGVGIELIPPLSWKVKLSLVAIFSKGFLDVIGNYAVMPALIFYVRELGGTESQYGLISAASSFASCLTMPVYASWVDAAGNKFRNPIFCGMALAALGMLLYTLAIVFVGVGNEGLAVHVLLAARLVYGIGGASGSLAVSYVTAVVPPEQLTSVILTMGAFTFSGLGVAPYVNAYLANVNTTIHLMGFQIPLNPYNSVGLLIAAFEVFGFVLVYFLLPEPSEQEEESTDSDASVMGDKPKRLDGGWKAVFHELTHDIKLFLPLFAFFAAQSNYQLIEVSFPPAVGHGLAWGPVEVSKTLAYSSMVMGVATVVATVLSTKFNVTDTTLIVSGNAFWAVGGIAMYTLWTYPATMWHYVAPIVISLIGSPLLYPANQSNFYKATMARSELEPIQTRLQSIYGMTGEIANFVTPLFVGSFILRSPSEVEESKDNHELTPLALYVPLFAVLCMVGFLYEKIVLHADDDSVLDTDSESESESEEDPAIETTRLLKKNPATSLVSINQSLTPQAKSKRMRASSIMGGNHSMPLIIPFETPQEKTRRLKYLRVRKHWENMIERNRREYLVETPSTLSDISEALFRDGNKKVVVLITSYSPNLQTRSYQDRAMTILRGLKIGDGQIEIIDGALAVNREKRNELFGISGIQGKYPQFFLVNSNDETTFLADCGDFEAMNEMGTLKESMNLI